MVLGGGVFRPQSRRRRSLLQAGGLGALNLLGLWRAQAAARQSPSTIRACIFVFYYGGPSHLDLWDPKPTAPAEVRGEFGVIRTTATGVAVSEQLPQLAQQMHRVALIRSMHHRMTAHDSASSETLTGRPPVGGDRETFPDTPETFPSLGAGLSYAWRDRGIHLPWASLPFVMNNVLRNPGQTPGFLGGEFAPFQVEGDPTTLTYRGELLKPAPGLTPERLRRRRQLAVSPGESELDPLYRRAFDLIDSPAVREALDLTRETDAVRQRYGWSLKDPYQQGGSGGAEHGYGRNLRGQNLLAARRLVEAGVPFVNVYDFRQQGQNWDSHTENFRQIREHLAPPMDRALAALIGDLADRGLLESTLVVATGEFGRTPKINGNAGRDHWPYCYTTLLAGGGVRGGIVIGSSDATGSYPDERPVTPGDLAATIFERFGVSPETRMLDSQARPIPLAEGRPITELF